MPAAEMIDGLSSISKVAAQGIVILKILPDSPRLIQPREKGSFGHGAIRNPCNPEALGLELSGNTWRLGPVH